MAPPAFSRLGSLSEEVAARERAVDRVATAPPIPARTGDAGLGARARIARILDPGGEWFEIGALIGHDRHDGLAGAAGLVTGIGEVAGRPVVVVASVPGAGAGWWPETVRKLLRAQEVAFRQRLPISYLLEGGWPMDRVVDGGFPGGYGPSRVLALAAAMRRSGRSPQIAASFGIVALPAALLAALADRSVTVAAEGLDLVRDLLAAAPVVARIGAGSRAPRPPRDPIERVAALLPADHRRSYDMEAVLRCVLDAGELIEFQPRHAIEMLCGHGWIEGIPVAVIANRRGLVPDGDGRPPRVGGIIYASSARKTGFFIETASRQGIPILFVQDVSGFMLGVEAEHSGIIRSGAGMVEAMATARSPRITLTVNHASGAGYYAMASQGFEPDFTLSWPTGRIGAMEAEAAISAVHGTALGRNGAGARDSAAIRESMTAMRATFEQELTAVDAAARGHVDAIVGPESTRRTLAFLLRVTARTGPNP